MNLLDPQKCPSCGVEMHEYSTCVKKTTKYEDCVRQCRTCHIGVSNSRQNPTVIYKRKEDNFPEMVWDGMDDVLTHALNVQNRKNKIARMGFVTSEDAFTWVFMKHLSREENLGGLQSMIGMQGQITDVLLWGISIMRPDRTSATERLKSTCRDFGEAARRFSEPDVIIETEKEVVFIEVKLSSANSTERNAEKYRKYLVPEYYDDQALAIESGLYELVRNWSIGNKYAGEKTFRLVNLGPEKLFGHRGAPQLTKFKSSISRNDCFSEVAWEDIFETPFFKLQPPWFKDDLARRYRRISG